MKKHKALNRQIQEYEKQLAKLRKENDELRKRPYTSDLEIAEYRIKALKFENTELRNRIQKRIIQIGLKKVIPLPIYNNGKVFLSFFINPNYPLDEVKWSDLSHTNFIGALRFHNLTGLQIVLNQMLITKRLISSICDLCGNYLYHYGDLCNVCSGIETTRKE